MKRLSLAIVFFCTSSGVNSWGQLTPELKGSQGSIVPSTEIRLVPGQDNVGNTPADVGGIPLSSSFSLYKSVRAARASKPTAELSRATPVPLTPRQALLMMRGSATAKYSNPASFPGIVGLKTGDRSITRTVRTDSQLMKKQLINAGAIMLVQSVNPNSGFPEAYSLGRRGFEALRPVSSRREPVAHLGTISGGWGNEPGASEPADGSKKLEKPLTSGTSGVVASQAGSPTPSVSKPGAPAGSDPNGGNNGGGNNHSNKKSQKGYWFLLAGAATLGSAGILFTTHHFGAYVLTNPFIAGIAILGIGLVGLGSLFLYKGRDATRARDDLQGLKLNRPLSDQERAAIRLKTDADIVRETGQTPKPFGRDSKTLEWDLGFASNKPSQQDGGFWQSLKELFSKETVTSLVRERHKLYSLPGIRVWGSANVSPVELPLTRTGEKFGARLETGVSFFPSSIKTTVLYAGAWWLAAAAAVIFLQGAAAIITGGALVVGGAAIAAYKFRIGSSVLETTGLGKTSRDSGPVKKSSRNFTAIARKYYREGLLAGALAGILAFVGYEAYRYQAPAEQTAAPKTETIVTKLEINPNAILNAIGAGSNGDIKSKATGKGGGGQHDNGPVTRGKRPRFSRMQLTPPLSHPNPNPKLAADPTLLGPPELNQKVPNISAPNFGDPRAQPGPPSLGNGKGTGIGNGEGGGLGDGKKSGYGGGEAGNGGGVQVGYRGTLPGLNSDAIQAGHHGATVVLAFRLDPSRHIVNPDGPVQKDKDGNVISGILVIKGFGFHVTEDVVAAIKHLQFFAFVGKDADDPKKQIVEGHYINADYVEFTVHANLAGQPK